ncbi:hypothetical protein J2Y42_002524 [Leifsonia sp. 1010]|nr:hypothetical protein [Leifsonia sp. 1010]
MPRVLVSWAHRGEGWTDREASDWAREVVEFTGALRANGINADLDLFHSHETETDWTRFGPAQVKDSDFVVIAISEAWAQRWEGTNSLTVGAGAVAEADALKGLFQRDQGAWQRKVIVAILPSQSEDAIPEDLMRATRFWVAPDNPDSLETLVRTLTSQPLYAKPELGEIPVLPPAVAESLGRPKRASESPETEFGDYSAVLEEVKKQKRATRSEPSSDRLNMLMGLLDALSQ